MERRKCGNTGEIPLERKENWRERQKKTKIKESGERRSWVGFAEKGLRRRREKVASNENVQRRKRYLREDANVGRRRSFVLSNS